jgi:hypothetical protein
MRSATEAYGGSGLGLCDAVAILETVHANGGNGSACHAQMYVMGIILRQGSEAQKCKWLPNIASGELRLQAFGVTEPTAGTDTTSIKTTAVRDGDHYLVNGQKIWTSRAEHSDLMVLLARTTPKDKVTARADGLSILVVEMCDAVGNGLTIRPIRTVMNHATTEVFFDNLKVPAENLIGEQGNGFPRRHERRAAADRRRACRRRHLVHQPGIRLFARPHGVRPPIGQNQGVQFPICRDVRLAADGLPRRRPVRPAPAVRQGSQHASCWRPKPPGMRLRRACRRMAASECDVERKFRERRLYQVAPVSRSSPSSPNTCSECRDRIDRC